MKTYNPYARQAIFTKYLPATNTRPSKVKAYCERGSITVSYDATEGSNAEPFSQAVEALLAKFEAEDGTDRSWGKIGQWVCGGSPKNEKTSYVFVNVGK